MPTIPIPDAPVVPQYPALGSLTFNQQAYAYGTAMPGVTLRVHEIAVAARANAIDAALSASSANTTSGHSAASAILAGNWATKTDGYVSGSEVSSKSWAVGGTGNGQPTAGSAKDWATKTDGYVSGSEVSSKSWAVGGTGNGQPTAGSAKDWATKTGIVSGGEYSAKHYATAAGASASSASQSRDSALSSATFAGKLNLGNHAVAPTTDREGDPILVGATYYDTTLNKARVYGTAGWTEGISAVAGVSSINGLTGDIVLPPPQLFAYDSRATLRSHTPANQVLAFVDGLGLFVFQENSDEPDDDESCFATATGCWLLQCPSWDVVDAWQLPEVEERDAYDEDEPQRFAASFATKVLTGSATCAITSVTTVSSVSFTGTVTGASVGDCVIATPPAELGATSAETGRLSYHARVSAANTVTVTLTNASASNANTSAAIRAAWPISVIKP